MAELRFSKAHVWVNIDGDVATLGLSDYAQKQLRDIVFIELPKAGQIMKKEGKIASIESVKTISEVISPLTGTIVEVNAETDNDPSQINDKPYDAWLIKMKIENKTELKELISEQDYKKITR